MAALTYDITSTMGSRYGTYDSWNFGGSSWTTYNSNSGDSNRFYIGPVNGYNCRAALKVTTPNVKNIKKIVIGVKADQAITPLYTRGYLNATFLDPNTANWSGTLSYYYTSAAATTRFTSYQSSPSMGYFVFSGSFSANTTYYCHIATWSSDSAALNSNTSSGWIRGQNMSGYVTAYVEYYPTYNQVYYPNGAASGSAATYEKTHDTTYTLLSSMPSSWTKKANTYSNYSITLNGNGGTSPASKTSTKTTTYSLGGWLEGSTSGTQRALGYSYTTNSAKNWYAYWSGTGSWSTTTLGTTSRDNTTADGYTVSFNANGGTTTPSSLTATDTTKYTFVSWNTAKDGSGNSYDSTTAHTFKANYTLYAQWSSSTTKGSITLPAAITKSKDTTIYTINFNENFTDGGTSSLSSTKTITYTFAGWNTNSSGTGTTYSAKASYTPTSTRTLYAKWTSATTQTSITLPSLTRTGYKLLGWATSSTATTATYSAGASVTPTANMTLYAVWEATTQVYIYHDGQWMRALKYVWDTSSIVTPTTSNLLDEGLLDEMEIS